MQFEVYCDENYPDLFTSRDPKVRYMFIGSLWLPAELRKDAKEAIKAVREKHGLWGEIKWIKVSGQKLPFYLDLLNVFFSFAMDMRFRCIAIDNNAYNSHFHNQDDELGFYKFYYQLIHHWILDYNEYTIFCDKKINSSSHRLHELKRCLSNSNILSKISAVQALPSQEVALMQICDLLLGVASSRINGALKPGSAKEALTKHVERKLNKCALAPTPRSEAKFNIFKILLQGGW